MTQHSRWRVNVGGEVIDNSQLQVPKDGEFRIVEQIFKILR